MKVICQCSNVRESDVIKFREMYPNMAINQMKHALKIGNGCGCCQTPECPVTDITFEEVINSIDEDF